MSAKNKIKSKKISSHLASKIIVEREKMELIEGESYPYCRLPEGFFETVTKRLSSLGSKGSQRTLFSVRTWDGRKILSVTSG